MATNPRRPLGEGRPPGSSPMAAAIESLINSFGRRRSKPTRTEEVQGLTTFAVAIISPDSESPAAYEPLTALNQVTNVSFHLDTTSNLTTSQVVNYYNGKVVC